MQNYEISAREAAIRILGREAATRFHFIHTPRIRFGEYRIGASDDQVFIRGDSGVSMLCGLNWYLRNVLQIHVSWETKQPDIPDRFPLLPEAVTMASPYRYRYYLNYCTFSYTMAFWDWPRWEKELDLMALGGVNLALNLVGQECVWLSMLTKLGMTPKQARGYLTDPAHLAWFYMGNMTRFGGDLPEKWFEDRQKLGCLINKRMLELGITPVLPGFYGLLPESLLREIPDAHLSSQGEWCGFERPACVSPTDALFEEAGRLYYTAQQQLFGNVTPYFTAEPFHENNDAAGFDLPLYGKKILSLMRRVRPDAVWVLQAWDSNPYLELFDALKPDDVLILNLLAGRIQDSREILGDFEGRPWVWCPVHSYGGRNGLYGFLRTLAREPLELTSKPCTSMCGIGLAPESLETNPVFYDLFWDITYRTKPVCLQEWLSHYVTRRYGKYSPVLDRAWQLLEDSVYNSFLPQPGGAESFLCARPDFGLVSVSTWGPKNVNYDTCFIRKAARLFYSQFPEYQENPSYLYDLADLTRQALSNISRVKYARLMYLLAQHRYETFRRESEDFLLLLETQEQLLSSRPEFSMEKWLAPARVLDEKYRDENHRDKKYEERLFERAAKTLITVWGPRTAAVLHDYSAREWGGLTGSFYYMRWKYFFNTLLDWLDAGKPLNLSVSLSRDWAANRAEPDVDDRFTIDWYTWEENWINSPLVNPIPPLDTGTAVHNAFQRFIDVCKDH
ncbi:alpha-N-acetylglucosaminidase [Diplocloster hominis]|uniref:alpha-N-acetylglucosaminidase n=1 Tax=Diplocloster hominis TaxID=3079010 RepID=UPI0031BA6600